MYCPIQKCNEILQREKFDHSYSKKIILTSTMAAVTNYLLVCLGLIKRWTYIDAYVFGNDHSCFVIFFFFCFVLVSCACSHDLFLYCFPNLRGDSSPKKTQQTMNKDTNKTHKIAKKTDCGAVYAATCSLYLLTRLCMYWFMIHRVCETFNDTIFAYPDYILKIYCATIFVCLVTPSVFIIQSALESTAFIQS